MKSSRIIGPLALLIPGVVLLTVHVVQGSQYFQVPYETINKTAEVVVIGKVTKITELPAYGNPKIEPRLVSVRVITAVRGQDTPKELTFQTRKHFGLDYKVGMEGVFFFRQAKDGQVALVDERGVGVFDRQLSSRK